MPPIIIRVLFTETIRDLPKMSHDQLRKRAALIEDAIRLRREIHEAARVVYDHIEDLDLRSVRDFWMKEIKKIDAVLERHSTEQPNPRRRGRR